MGEDKKQREKLTVLVPCKDEEHNIRDCLESVKWADEILMADSGSTDKTMEIGKEFGARIIQREYINSANMKNWAIPQAANEWVMVIDADERCTPELRNEILKELENPRRDGYRIYRRNFFLGKEIKHGGWERDDVLRLFRRDISRYKERRVHADVIVETGSVGVFSGKLLHYTYRSFSRYFKKMDRYSTWSAEDLKETGKKASFANIFLRPHFRFWKMYFLRLGFLDGKAGLIMCMLAAFSVFSKYIKLWSLTEAPNRNERPEGEA